MLTFDRQSQASGWRWFLLPAVLLMAIGGAMTPWRVLLTPRADRLWHSAASRAKQADWQQAHSLAQQALQDRPPSAREWSLAGKYAYRAGDVSAAEQAWQQVRETDPGNQEALQGLAEIWRLSGRYHDLQTIAPELLQTGDCPSAVLFALAWPDKIWLDEEDRLQIDRLLRHRPDARWIGLARWTADALTEDSVHHATEFAEQAAGSPAGRSEALARWGTLLMESGRWDRLEDWRRQLTDRDLAHPQIWYLFGLWQRRDGHNDPALRCFWEALERAPYHAGATYQIAQLLPRGSNEDAASAYARQSELLSELRQAVVFGQGGGGFPDAMVLRRIVGILGELARDREAIGWCTLAAARHPELNWPAVQIAHFQTRLTASPTKSWPCTTEPVSRRFRLDHYPLPDWQSDPGNARDFARATTEQATARFENVAEARGLRFRFTNGSQNSKPNGFMYEISGGGVGILDYDGDGWPDVYLSQGGPELSQPRDPTTTDRLFRNRFGARMEDMTPLALQIETGYGQGIAAGDINSDGFPDLFIANIGRNQLWMNQGDGTFVDATSTAGFTEAVWTMSAAIADFNGDGLADIYEVNYLGGEALRRTCLRDGVVVQCRPSLFPAEPDRLWINRGDGSFANESEVSGILQSPGKGMGVIAADLNGQGQLSLFVTNDMEPNALFHNTAARGESPRYVDEAWSVGVAVGEDGNPLASMGIAIDDIDQNGHLDLYVTNFQTEASNLYLQVDHGVFADGSRPYGVYERSAMMMGWGAQWLDANLDGWPDLIVANGHLEDYRRWQILSAMPTQFFQSQQGQRLSLIAEAGAGEYFQELHFGRSVVRGDLNRDGREDALVTHVDAPVAWLENDTRPAGHFLAVRLVGTTTERDAIGTRLQVTAGGRVLNKQLVAGDGFQCSNQRLCIIGLGKASAVDKLQIDWPSGCRQSFSNVPADQEIVLRESAASYYFITGISASPEATP